MKLRNTLIGSLIFASFGVASADYPLLPPNGTDELYALEQECDCVLSITPDASISVLISKNDILTLFGLDTSEQSNDDVRIFNHGIVVLDDGALVFGAQVSESVPDEADIVRDALIKRQADGTLEQLLVRINTNDNDGGSFEGLVIGNDGFLYVMDDSNDSMLQVNANTGAFITYATKANFESVTSSVEFVATPGLAADENYLYVASDRIPNVIYRVNYDVMGGDNPVQDIYGAGPNGVDPAMLTPYDTTLYLFPTDPPLTPDGNFEIELNRDDGTSETTAQLPHDASTADVEMALETAAGVNLTVTGAGTLLDPWRFLRPSEFTSVNNIDVDLVGLLPASSSNGQEAVPVDNHIEHVAVEAASGTFRLDIELTGVVGAGRTIADLEFNFDVTASEIANALLAIDGIEAGDITVSGSGTFSAPWVFTFGGQFTMTPVEMGVFDITDPNGISRVGSFVDAGALDDPDGFLTRQPDGNILVPDDSSGHFLYQLAVNSNPVESVTTLLTEWDLVVANGGRANMEGGVAYDSNGVLYAASFVTEDSAPGTIFRIQPNLTITRWVTREDIAEAIGIPEEDVPDADIIVEGIAFSRTGKINVDIKVNPPWRVLYLSKWIPIPVAIFGSDSFDVKTIDKKSLTLGSGKTKPIHFSYITDVNNDGYKDYVTFFKSKGTGLKKGKQNVCVCGTAGGEAFEGCDEIYVKPIDNKKRSHY